MYLHFIVHSFVNILKEVYCSNFCVGDEQRKGRDRGKEMVSKDLVEVYLMNESLGSQSQTKIHLDLTTVGS